jgi:hypothetical protein
VLDDYGIDHFADPDDPPGSWAIFGDRLILDNPIRMNYPVLEVSSDQVAAEYSQNRIVLAIDPKYSLRAIENECARILKDAGTKVPSTWRRRTTQEEVEGILRVWKEAQEHKESLTDIGLKLCPALRAQEAILRNRRRARNWVRWSLRRFRELVKAGCVTITKPRDGKPVFAKVEPPVIEVSATDMPAPIHRQRKLVAILPVYSLHCLLDGIADAINYTPSAYSVGKSSRTRFLKYERMLKLHEAVIARKISLTEVGLDLCGPFPKGISRREKARRAKSRAHFALKACRQLIMGGYKQLV